MKENRPYFCFIILVLAVLLLPTLVHSQGDDFGSGGYVGGTASWYQVPAPALCCGSNSYKTGFLGQPFHFLPNGQVAIHQGDTVHLHVYMTFWGLVPLSFSPGSGQWISRDQQNHSEQNMRWVGPANSTGQLWHPGLGYFCFDCYFDMEAGEDNPEFWLDYTSPVDPDHGFGAYIEVVGVTPNSSGFPVFAVTQEDKDRAGYWSSVAGDAGGWLGAISSIITPYSGGAGTAFGAFSGGFFIIQQWMDHLHNDPWTDQFPYPYDGDSAKWNTGLSCDGTWELGWDFFNYCQDFVNQMGAVAFYGDFAAESANRSNSCVAANAGCEWWQKDRTVWGIHSMGDALANAANDMWVMRWYLEYYGLDAGNSDFTVYTAQLLGDAAQWAQGVQ